MKKLLSLFALMMAFASPATAGEKEEILNVIDRFFTALKDRDAEVWREIMAPEGTVFVNSNRTGEWVLSNRNIGDDIDRLATGTVEVDERIWDPQVLVHETIGMVWAPYDLFANGEFSHCGIDVFQMVKVEESWKIAQVTYTVEPEGCADLAPPPRG